MRSLIQIFPKYFSKKHRWLSCIVFLMILFVISLSRMSKVVKVRNAHHDNSRNEELIVRHPKILAKDQFVHRYLSKGSVFKETGAYALVTGDITTSLVHSFSPTVERRVAGMFADPLKQHTFLANAPTFKWHKGELVTVLRIWLLKEQYKLNNKWPANDFHDNYLFIQKFDQYFKPITNGSLLGIPSNKNWDVGDGPLEPRLFEFNGKLYVSYNIALLFGDNKALDETVIWDIEAEQVLLPKLKNAPVVPRDIKHGIARDKHWVPYTNKDHIYFVHTLDPLKIMKCNLPKSFSCEFILGANKKVLFDDFSMPLRGGTPFEFYQYPYHISVGHVTLFKRFKDHDKIRRYYTTNMVVLSVEPVPRIVYVGDKIRVHTKVLNSVPIVRTSYIEDPFLFPVGLILEDKDTLYLGVHVNDYSSVVFRIRGIKKIMNQIIALDSIEKPQNGPPSGHLHKCVKLSAERISGFTFKINYQN